MVRFKNRYLTVEVNTEGNTTDVLKIKSQSLYSAIINKVQQLHGDFGVASMQTAFSVKCKVTKESQSLVALIRTRHGPHRFVASVLPFITVVDHKPVVIRTLYTGATIKQCLKFIIKNQKSQLVQMYETLNTNPERKEFEKAVKKARSTYFAKPVLNWV